ncbi:LMBR1-like membrane protein-domain-containing protein [Absidia repens]|uniref:LMBR1-like membrane protein-domain-containing protein n=1 Tax=Absidia repens TaxID=90262 RepID=A0A1X2IZX1_9FUNG|nr:LMBR1-like membrane protein-domain-containing protein [Absidia repens]
MIEESNWVPLVLSIITLFFIVLSLVSFYGNIKTQPWYVSVACVIGWFFPFWIVLLLPLDMASTLYEDCGVECRRPLTWVSEPVLYVAWRTIYWTSFCLTWMVIPMMQAFVNTGEFNILKRLKSAAKVNIRFYTIYVVLGILGLFYLVFKGGITTRAKLQAFVMAMANSWGLFLVIMFMGYGLVAVPRKLWYATDIKRLLNEIYTKAPRVKEECMDSELEFNELAKTINTISYRPLRSDPHLRKLVDNTTKRFPFTKHPDYADRDHSAGIPQTLTEEYIVTLNRNMILASRMKARKSALWNNLLAEAFYLQDIETNKANSHRRFQSSIQPQDELSSWAETKSRIEWWWVIVFRTIVYRILAVILGVISICILWSELTFNVQSYLISIVGLAINACGLNYAAIEVLSFFVLTWMCLCVYTSLFKIRFFNLYLLIPHHHTDPNSLLWFTGYMCKMMAPLCYNYINLLGSTEILRNKSETVFSQFMGKADLVPFLGTTFMDWFPVLILVPALSAFFNAPSFRWFGDSNHNGDNNQNDLESSGQLDVSAAEGRELILEERKSLERSLHPEVGPPPGLLDRAKNIFDSYSSKYGLPQSNTQHTDGSTSNQQHHRRTLSPSARQERDKRLDALISNRRQAKQLEQQLAINNDDQNPDIPFNAKLQSFGDNMKLRFGHLFTPSEDTDGHGQDDEALDSSSYLPEDPPLIRPSVPGGGGRVLGRANYTSASSSRASSPNPFQKVFATAWQNQQSTTA